MAGKCVDGVGEKPSIMLQCGGNRKPISPLRLDMLTVGVYASALRPMCVLVKNYAQPTGLLRPKKRDFSQ